MHFSALKIASILTCSAGMLGAVGPAAACTKNNQVRPADVAANEIQGYFVARNYAKLDELFKKYAKEKTATSDGISALSVFFKGISEGFNHCAWPRRGESHWIAHQEILSDWHKSSPNSDGPKLALALFTIEYGWYGRGYGTINTVNAEAKQRFTARMSSAKNQLDEIASTSQSNPAWYAGMMTIGMAQGWPSGEIDRYYRTAAKIDPYYIDIHYTMAEFYSPRWYGSVALQDAAINTAAELTKERFGQTMYTRLHWSHSDSVLMFEQHVVNWKRMKTGFEDYLRLFSDQKTLNSYAKFACYAEDHQTLRQVWPQIGDQIDSKVYPSEQWYQSCARLAKMT